VSIFEEKRTRGFGLSPCWTAQGDDIDEKRKGFSRKRQRCVEEKEFQNKLKPVEKSELGIMSEKTGPLSLKHKH